MIITRDKTPSYLLLKSEYQNGRSIHKKYEAPYEKELSNIVPLVTIKNGASNNDDYYNDDYHHPKFQEEIDMIPLWLNKTTDIDNNLSKISDLIVKLKNYHDNNLLPNMEDTSKLEKSIEITTQEITRLFHKTKELINKFGYELNLKGDSKRLKNNIQSSKFEKLHQLSLIFRQRQRLYLTALQKRSNSFKYLNTSTRTKVEDFNDEDEDELIKFDFTDEQKQIVNDMMDNITQRDKEIRELLVSIADLSSLFNDISLLVNQQSGLLDNIENNLSNVEDQVIDAAAELDQTNIYHKEYRSRMCILMVLICGVVSMFMIYILRIIF